MSCSLFSLPVELLDPIARYVDDARSLEQLALVSRRCYAPARRANHYIINTLTSALRLLEGVRGNSDFANSVRVLVLNSPPFVRFTATSESSLYGTIATLIGSCPCLRRVTYGRLPAGPVEQDALIDALSYPGKCLHVLELGSPLFFTLVPQPGLESLAVSAGTLRIPFFHARPPLQHLTLRLIDGPASSWKTISIGLSAVHVTLVVEAVTRRGLGVVQTLLTNRDTISSATLSFPRPQMPLTVQDFEELLQPLATELDYLSVVQPLARGPEATVASTHPLVAVNSTWLHFDYEYPRIGLFFQPVVGHTGALTAVFDPNSPSIESTLNRLEPSQGRRDGHLRVIARPQPASARNHHGASEVARQFYDFGIGAVDLNNVPFGR